MRASSNKILLWLATAFVVYLCWLLVAPFLPALAFAFALAMLGEPMFTWILGKFGRRNLAALGTVVMICLILVLPMVFLAQALGSEAIRTVNGISADDWRRQLEANPWIGTAMRWLDVRLDLPKEAEQLIRGAAQWLTNLTSSIVGGSARALTQIVTMVIVLFYFLRDQEFILETLRSLVPLCAGETDRLFAKIAETIRVSMYGKVVVAFIQGGLGGLIFWWMGLPGPVFWGLAMALLSILPVLGAFVIWVPAAAALALQGDWARALILTGWGIAVVHPVDNFLGPVLVGSKLHLHTLLIFFSVIGGLAAFGASGLVLGPVTIAVAISLFEIRRAREEEARVAHMENEAVPMPSFSPAGIHSSG